MDRVHLLTSLASVAAAFIALPFTITGVTHCK
jgi:hypothetical protein